MNKQRSPFSHRKQLHRALALLVVLACFGELIHRFGPGLRQEIELHRATRAVEVGRFDVAEPRLDGLIAQNPRDTRARLLLVQVYRRQGRITEAEETLQRAVELGLSIDEARAEHDLIRRLALPPGGSMTRSPGQSRTD